ncbi:MAG TPA: DUF1570 domain-containing protein [Thermoanaerobaculia bacterium]|nr:DUF1570 domain-containing protein [Thermoanaerobaculia bacterium]
MNRLAPLLLLGFLLGAPLLAQDVYVPPVPKGIGVDGKVRTPNAPIPFPSAKGRWIRVRSGRFNVFSSANETMTRDIVSDLETLASALSADLSKSDGTAGTYGTYEAKATVFIFGNPRDSRPYFDLLFARVNSRANGAYVRHEGGGTMFIGASRRIERTAMHELIHDLLRQGEIAPPLWLEEGLAEYFSNAVIQGGRVRAGAPIEEHISLLRRRTAVKLDDVIHVKAESAKASTTEFYAASWAVVEWLIQKDEAAFFRLLRDTQRGGAAEEALQTHYGKAAEELAVGIRWRDRIPKLITLAAQVPQPAEAAEPLDRATLLYELGRFLSYVAGAEKDSTRHYREALNADPKHARTLAAIGEYERAVAAGPNDPDVHLLYAESLLSTAQGVFAGIFEPAAGDAENFRKARTLAERALELGGDEGRARGILGTTYLVETDIAPGIVELERARALVPQRMDYALNLYAMYLRTGARDKADALFAAAFENARDKQTIFAARNVLVTAETARANTLAQSGKLEEAAAIVRQLAAATPDPRGRLDLEQQAAQLESTAAVNRHIQSYNEAVALANTGKNREAVQVLDELLKVATDPSVVRDAKELRNDLKKRR